MKPSRRGFTLIELLVVVAVLALLASIVFSNLGGAREGARISNALSFQSQTHSLLGSDLVGWWNFNEGDARDISGYNNHGTVVGATHVTGVPGTGGSALEFNGSSDYVSAGNPLILSEGLTISYWIKLNSYHNVNGYWTTAITNHIDSTNGFYNAFSTAGNPTITVVKNGNTYRRNSATPIGLNEWVHISYIWRGGDNFIFYQNTQELSLTTGSGLTYPSVSDFVMARRGNINAGYINGLIDDVRIYSRALSASEIQTLYAQTKDNYLAND